MATCRDGQEAQSGAIRGDPAWLRGRGDNPGVSQEARGPSADGASGDRQRYPAGAEKHQRQQSKLGRLKEAIDRILEDDRTAPRKQRHTAHRIWTRLRQECPDHVIAEATVRRYVQRRKQELGLTGRVAFVPQSYDWGQEAQVDWFEAVAKLDGEPSKLQDFRDAQHGVGRRLPSRIYARHAASPVRHAAT